MNGHVIRLEGVSKSYRLGLVSTKSLSHDINRWWHLVRGKEDPYSKVTDSNTLSVADGSEYVWAVKDVNIEVLQGEVLGIIGRNGAGKSTILKLLSRVTAPTAGCIKVRGRIASLLEVGTGFHPELTGRENIFLNGAIMGMEKRVIRRRFDEIVDFSEVGKYIDTPVKRYSSGMYVRLAFAVAAYLDAEILIIDEVLAVGDASFQKKCLGKMGDVAESGRTVLFVSHNMGSIKQLCSRVVTLENGTVVDAGEPSECVMKYLSQGSHNETSERNLVGVTQGRRGTGQIRFTKIRLCNEKGNPSCSFMQRESFSIELTIEADYERDSVFFGWSFVSSDGVEVFGSTAHDSGPFSTIEKGVSIYKCMVNPNVLVPGSYSIRAAIFKIGSVYDHVDELLSFSINEFPVNGDAPLSHSVGYVYIPYSWSRVLR